MKSPKTLLAILAGLGLVFASGCLGALDTGNPGPIGDDDDDDDDGTIDPDPDPDPDDGEAIFNANIKPMITGCGVAGCHSGAGTDPLKFLGPGGEENFYGSIVQYAQVHGNWDIQQAALITKLDISAANGEPHYGYQPWDAAQTDMIAEWFDVERLAREGDDGSDPDPTGPIDTRTLFAEWSGCMTLENWNTANMGDWSEKGTQNGQCQNCHNEGQFWININPDNDAMFAMNRYELFIPGFFAARLNPDGTGEIIPAYDKLVRMGQGNVGGSLHPTYNTDVDNDRYFQYLTEFYNLTVATKAAGACGPAAFPQP